MLSLVCRLAAAAAAVVVVTHVWSWSLEQDLALKTLSPGSVFFAAVLSVGGLADGGSLLLLQL